MRDLVIIDNSVIDVLINDRHFAAKIPCLSNPPILTAPNYGCGSCGSSGSKNVDYNAIKNCLGMLDSQNLKLLKQRLNAVRIRLHRVVTRNGKQEGIKHTR